MKSIGKGGSASSITSLRRKLAEARSYSQTDKKKGSTVTTDIAMFRSAFNEFNKVTGAPLGGTTPPPGIITITRTTHINNPIFELTGDGTIDWGNGTTITFIGSYYDEIPDDTGSTITILSSNLTYADLNENNNDNTGITSIVLTGFTVLTELYCGSLDLTSLDVSGCTALEVLYCYNNQLSSLDVSGYTALIDLDCGENLLTSLNVSGLTKLEYLSCYTCPNLETLTIIGCSYLVFLDASSCNLIQTAADTIAGVLANNTIDNGSLYLDGQTSGNINTADGDYVTLRGRGWLITPPP